MPKNLTICISLLLTALSGWAHADEASVKRILQGRFPTMPIESVSPSPFQGLYEVLLGGEIIYTDEKGEYIFSGSIFDVRTQPPRNMTQERANRAVASELTQARELAIKRVRGNGTRVLFTFEDPNCAYCKALQKELAQLDNVTIYTFLTPLLSDDSIEKSLAVWCSKDRTRAWEELMSAGIVPRDSKSCANPLDRIAAITERLRVDATPAIFLGDGRHIGGMRSAADIEKALATVK